MFCFVAAFLSAFLDALTVTAVLIAVAVGFYRIFHLANSGVDFSATEIMIIMMTVLLTDSGEKDDLENFKAFLRDLIMHGVVGTALGGVCTIVGEPQNLLIANIAGWEFIEFMIKMAPITVPVFIAGNDYLLLL
jgi:NhaB family Na+:H+ antiporter